VGCVFRYGSHRNNPLTKRDNQAIEILMRLGYHSGMNEVTRIQSAIGATNPQAAAQLLPLVYDELRRLAGGYMANESPGHTLNAQGSAGAFRRRLPRGAARSSKRDHSLRHQTLECDGDGSRRPAHAQGDRSERYFLVEWARSMSWAGTSPTNTLARLP
jgi:ECF sigma factor